MFERTKIKAEKKNKDFWVPFFALFPFNVFLLLLLVRFFLSSLLACPLLFILGGVSASGSCINSPKALGFAGKCAMLFLLVVA